MRRYYILHKVAMDRDAISHVADGAYDVDGAGNAGVLKFRGLMLLSIFVGLSDDFHRIKE